MDHINVLVDESGDTSNRKIANLSKANNRVVGALIFSKDIQTLKKELKNFVDSDSELKKLVTTKPRNLKYETIANLNNSELIFLKLLEFLVSKGCKFYLNPVDQKKGRKDSPRTVEGEKLSLRVIRDGWDIFGNIVLSLRAKGKEIGQVNIYCDKAFYEKENINVAVNSESHQLCVYLKEEKLHPNNEFKEFYSFPVFEEKSNGFLHNMADIVAGILSRNYYETNKTSSYNFLIKHLFVPLVENTIFQKTRHSI